MFKPGLSVNYYIWIRKKSDFHLWRTSKAGANHKSRDFGKNLLVQIKVSPTYITSQNTYCRCILACSASLLRAQNEVMNTTFDLFDFFHFRQN